MAIIRDKKLLALALEWKANPKHAAEGKFRYKGIEYDYEKEIFPSARFQFQKYDRAYKDNKTFAEAFARDLLRRNSELIAEINKGAKSAEEQIYYEEQPPAQTEAETTPPQQTPVGEAPVSMSGGAPFPATSSGAMAPRRIIRVVPPAREPGAITSSSSQATVKTTTISAPSAKPGSATVTSSNGFTPTGSTSISSPTTSASGSANIEAKTQIHAPKTLATAGPPVDNISKEATQPARGIKSGGTGYQFPKVPSGFKIPASFTNIGKNLLSNAQIFLKKNLVTGLAGLAGGLGGGLAFGGNPLGILGGGIGGVAGKSWLGNGGFAKIGNGIVDRASKFSNLASGRISATGNLAKSRIGLVLAGLFIFIIISAAASAILPGPQTGQAAPQTPGFINTQAPPNPDCPKLHDEIYNQFKVDFDQKNPFSCDYLTWAWEKLWNISNTKFLELVRGPDKNTVITVKREDKGFNEQTGCPSIIMSGISSVDQKPYPKSLFQVVFIHELTHVIQSCNPSAVNFTALAAALNKEGGITTFSQNPTKCISGVTQLNEDFAETLAYYLNPEWGEQSYFSSCPPKDNTNPVLRGDKPLHQQFAAELLGTGAPVPPGITQVSCPILGGGPNVLSSYQADPVNGHCGEKYLATGQVCTDGTNSRRAKSIDIETCINPRPACQIDTCQPLTEEQKANFKCGQSGKDVVLPTISGISNLSWTRLSNVSLSQGDCFNYEILDPNGLGGGCGVGYVFQADLGSGKNWVLHLLHMGPTTLEIGQSYPPNTIVGKTQAIHVHISVGKDIQNPLSQTEAGWLAADIDLKLCQ